VDRVHVVSLEWLLVLVLFLHPPDQRKKTIESHTPSSPSSHIRSFPFSTSLRCAAGTSGPRASRSTLPQEGYSDDDKDDDVQTYDACSKILLPTILAGMALALSFAGGFWCVDRPVVLLAVETDRPRRQRRSSGPNISLSIVSSSFLLLFIGCCFVLLLQVHPRRPSCQS
jgi:hypothetical protein